MKQTLLKQRFRYLLAAGLALNGLTMLFVPETWFSLVPGVWETGPFNPHLVRDVGCAYLVAAAGLTWRAWAGSAGRSAAIAGAGFLALHAGVHLWELAVGICGWRRFVQDIPGVVLPALMALWLAGPDQAEHTHA